MSATPLLRIRQPAGENAFVEIVVWQLPRPVPGSRHPYKYRLAYVVDGVCAIRYDNESGKGDHKHVGDKEVPFSFSDINTLMGEFWRDVDSWSAGT